MLIDITQHQNDRATREQVNHVISLLDVLTVCAQHSEPCQQAHASAQAFVQANEYGKATAARYADAMTLINDCVRDGRARVESEAA